MIGVSHVYGVILSFAHICRKRLTMIIVRCLVIRRAILLDEFLNKRIRAGGVIRCIRQRDNTTALQHRRFRYTELRTCRQWA